MGRAVIPGTTDAAQALQRDGEVRGPQMCALVGITYRQLDYWARTDLLVPSVAEARGQGTWRRYSRDDVVRGLLIRRLLEAGMGLPTVRRVVDTAALARQEGLRFLVVGRSARGVACAAEGLIDALREEGVVAVVIDLESGERLVA